MDIPEPQPPKSPEQPGRMYVVAYDLRDSTFVVQKGVLKGKRLEDVVLSWVIKHDRTPSSLGSRIEYINGYAFPGAVNIDFIDGNVRQSPVEVEAIYSFYEAQHILFGIRRKEVFSSYDASIAQIRRVAAKNRIEPKNGVVRGVFEIPWQLQEVLSKCHHRYRS